MSQQYQIPATPRVISPSPTPSESGDNPGSYFAPITRSAAKRATSPTAIKEEQDSDSDLEKRARTRSRSPHSALKRRRPSGLIPQQKTEPPVTNNVSNGHLSPAAAASYYWRELSRSPSPLGLIPIHRHWRSFIHRHEIPRKALHVSIGFFTLYLYTRGAQPEDIHPWLLGALVPIVSVEFLRHRIDSFNRFYIRCLGALMRESEVNEKYNGVIWYLLGAWFSLKFFPKDVSTMSILLLSWCDTAASTIGRLWGRYTPRIRKGKSLAGSAAAALVGVATSVIFYGVMVPRNFGYEEDLMYSGNLGLPEVTKRSLGLVAKGQGAIGGWLALGAMSLWSGLVASASEVVDIFGLDDNLTIPILSGLGLCGFLTVFG
jgi:diacylglycerol kinase (CTP)